MYPSLPDTRGKPRRVAATALIVSARGRGRSSSELKTLMREVNTSIDPHKEMQCIVVVKTPWIIDNGFLTPTMKIKRNVIEAHY